ncbi:MAG: hypothetical protein M5U26_28655 [Planctomycetota bacterium]|nr:hypothetical protein [Planctomycetota bacterium]
MFERWRALHSNLGARRPAIRIFDLLVAHYAEPHRAYHNLDHIAKLLHGLNEFTGLARDRDAVELGIWFHDVIYDPRAKDNEARSAAWAVEALRELGLPAEFGARVSALVLATAHAQVPVDADVRLLCDLDLAILAAPHEEYEIYERAIRREYA